MALLDHFRGQSRQKHPDPAVRLAFVQEIPVDERDLVAEIAREDPDARVRRAAVAKLMDPAALAGVAATDADESVRSDAVGMLRDIALDAFEGVTEDVSLAAVDAISDAKSLANIAKAGLRESVAARALARISDQHALGSVARHAVIEGVRHAAFGALADPGEVISVAMNSEFKDTAVAAVERLADRKDDLVQIATRARNKSAAKRARGLLREAGERAAAAAAQAQPSSGEVVGARELGHVADPVSPADEAARAAAQLEAVERERASEVARQVEEDARAAERRRQREADEETSRQRELERQKDVERRLSRLTELTDDAEGAVLDEDLASARRRFDIVGREWRDVATGLSVDAGVTARYGAARSAIEARERAAQDHAARTRREALARLQQLLGRVETLGARTDMPLKAAERALRDIRIALADVPPLPSRQEHDAVVHRLKAAQAALVPKVQELREAADWKRWANVGIQEQLCGKMEALTAIEDPEEIASQVRALQEQWKQAADVPRAQGEVLWKRFRAAHDAAWSRCAAHFAAQAQVRAENLAKKLALIGRAEALAESTSWIQTAEEIKRLQAEWKTIGSVTRGQEKGIWERFRSACDRFFTRRQADLSERKKVWSENLTKREALCVQVEALAESTDWEQTAGEIRRLQAEWKSIGPVKKSRSEAIWQRFRAGCDGFFARYGQRHAIAIADRVAAREAICAEIEALSPPSSEAAADAPVSAESEAASSAPAPSEPPADLAKSVRALRSRWHQEIAARGVDREKALALDERFQTAFTRVLSSFPAAFAGSDLDPDANQKRMEALVGRMEDLANSLAGPAGGSGDAALSPTARLAAMLKEALASNTIGGKVDESSRWLAAIDDVRHAQSNWTRIGPVPEAVRRSLAGRFERACRRITERPGGSASAGQAGRAGGSAVSSRPGGPARSKHPVGSGR